MPALRATASIRSDLAVTTTQSLNAIGAGDWVLLSGRVAVQLTGAATAVTAIVERSPTDPDVDGGSPAPAGAALNGNPSTGIPISIYEEAGVAWWRVRVTALTGAPVAIAISGRGVTRGAAFPALVVPAATGQVRLSTVEATEGADFAAAIQNLPGDAAIELRVNPGDRWRLNGTALTATGLKYGIDQPGIIIRRPGLSPQQIDFSVRVSRAAAVQPGAGGQLDFTDPNNSGLI